MQALFTVGQIAGVLVILLGAVVLLLEFYGYALHITRPYIRATGFRWSAINVAITGVSGAVLAAIFTIGGSAIVIVPGFITINPGRGLEPVLGLLFGVPGAAAALIANPIYDILTGKLTLGSISGAIGTALGVYIYYRICNRNLGLRDFRSVQTWGRFAVAAIVATFVAKALGISGWLDALNLVPQEVAWFVTFPALFLGQLAAQAIVGPILTKALHPYVDRMGLAPESGDRSKDTVPQPEHQEPTGADR